MAHKRITRAKIRHNCSGTLPGGENNAAQPRFWTQKWYKNHPKNDTKIRLKKTMPWEAKIKEKASKNGVEKELRTATFSDFVVLVIFEGCP